MKPFRIFLISKNQSFADSLATILLNLDRSHQVIQFQESPASSDSHQLLPDLVCCDLIDAAGKSEVPEQAGELKAPLLLIVGDDWNGIDHLNDSVFYLSRDKIIPEIETIIGEIKSKNKTKPTLGARIQKTFHDLLSTVLKT